MWNTIKSVFKKLFGLVDTDHNGKISTNEAQSAVFNSQKIVQEAKAEVKSTVNEVTDTVKARVKRVKEEVQDVIDTAKEAANQAQDVVEAAKGTDVRRGRKPKAQ